MKQTAKENIRNREISIEDSHDVEKHILQIHTKSLGDILTNDLLLGSLDEKQAKYVAEQVSLAHEAKYLLPEGEYRDYAVARLLLKGVTVVLLNRNQENNHLVKLLLKRQEELLQTPEPDLDRQIAEKLDKEKRG